MDEITVRTGDKLGLTSLITLLRPKTKKQANEKRHNLSIIICP